MPAVFNRSDGSFRYFEINAAGKGIGGSFVSADEAHYYVHTRKKGTRAFRLSTGAKTSFTPAEPVLHNGKIYSAETEDEKFLVRAYGKAQKKIWEIEADGSGDLILVGDHLVAAGQNAISVIALPSESEVAKIVSKIATDEPVQRLVAADDKLFTVTASGTIAAYGISNKHLKSVATKPEVVSDPCHKKSAEK